MEKKDDLFNIIGKISFLSWILFYKLKDISSTTYPLFIYLSKISIIIAVIYPILWMLEHNRLKNMKLSFSTTFNELIKFIKDPIALQVLSLLFSILIIFYYISLNFI